MPFNFIRDRRYFVGFALLIAALLVMMVGNFRRSMQYYMTVDEFLATPELVRGHEFRMAGQVVAGSLQRPADPAQPLYDFVIANAGKSIQVSYRGLVPDTFSDTSDVVVRGRWDEVGKRFVANHLLAKCASKYEAKLEHRPGGTAPANNR